MPGRRSPSSAWQALNHRFNANGWSFGCDTNELDSTIDNQLGFMTKRSIGLFLVVGVPANRLELVKVVFASITLGHLSVPFAKVTRAVTAVTKDIRVERRHGVGTRQFSITRRAVAAPGQAGQDRRPTDPAD